MDVSKVKVQNLHLSIDQPLLHDISLEASHGIHCFLGPNGVGKTLTNKALGLLLPATKGSVAWDDLVVNPFTEDHLQQIRQIGYMNQYPVFLNKSVFSNITLPLKIRGLTREEQNTIASQYLKEFKLDQFKDKFPHKLSLGQQQKVALLRALVYEPSILILDEPTASLDLANTKWFEELILDLHDQNNYIIFWTTHDQFQARRIADTVHVFIGGTVAESGPSKSIFENAQNEQIKAYLEGRLL